MTENKKILIVDDSKVVLMVMKKFFENKGYDVITKTSAIDGAKAIKKDNISLVITDINMPEFSGYDFLLWIRKNNPNKVIIMTAFGNQDVKKFVMNHGCISYFEKNSNYDALNLIVENILYDKNFKSNINEINLFEFFQLIILSNIKKYIKITDKSNNNIGGVYFEPGKIVHAKYDDLIGEEALYNITSISNGEFFDSEWEEPETKSINMPFGFDNEYSSKN